MRTPLANLETFPSAQCPQLLENKKNPQKPKSIHHISLAFPPYQDGRNGRHGFPAYEAIRMGATRFRGRGDGAPCLPPAPAERCPAQNSAEQTRGSGRRGVLRRGVIALVLRSWCLHCLPSGPPPCRPSLQQNIIIFSLQRAIR